jgi:transcriptional regulator with XRE-family HTH domain
MAFRLLRESRRLSQERVAEMSGLSLRTIQRLEAGHRVSYASLRSLAATFDMDVDVLERELYAMKQAADEFVEIPRWVRRFNTFWHGGTPRVSRRQAHFMEAFCIGGGLLFLALSFVVAADYMKTSLRVAGGFQLVVGYLVSVSIRIVDTYKLWPAAGMSLKEWWAWRPTRTLLGTVIDYGMVLAVVGLFFGLLFLLGS